jgi:hypothetical protein
LGHGILFNDGHGLVGGFIEAVRAAAPGYA